MTDRVLSQLVTVESELTEQIEHLEAQLNQLQIKRQELLSVIDMFDSDAVGKHANQSASQQPVSSEAQTPDEEPQKQQASAPDKADSTDKSNSTAKTKPGRQSAQKSGSTKKKKDGRAAVWQKYVQSQYKNLALPEAVSSVLRSHPSEIFKIADVMSSIFKESMPQTYYLKARNRISNILSAGARDGTWYRGRNGRYSQSEAVTKD